MTAIPFFSVIIPTYNRAKVLGRAIDSVLSQSFNDFELIIVDDGSVDNTCELVSSISDSRVSYIYQSNKGVCGARNHGASLASGNYLLFLDSDDLLKPEALVTINESARFNAFPDFIFSDLETTKPDGTRVMSLARKPGANSNEFGVFMVQAYSIRRDYFIKIGGFDEKINFGENSELRIRAFKHKFSSCFTDKVLSTYIQASNGGSQNLENRIRSNYYIINKHPDYFCENKRLLKSYLQSTAIIQVRLGKIREARKSIFKAFLVMPFDIYLLLRVIIIFIPFAPLLIWRKP